MRSGMLGRTARRAIAGSIALVLVAGTAAADPPGTRKQINEAKRRLEALEAQITFQQARAIRMADSMRALAAQVDAARSRSEAIRSQIAQTQRRSAEVEARYQAIRREIDRAAADAYVRGPGYAVEALLNQDSLSDAVYVLGYTTAITTSHSRLAEQARRTAAELKQQQRQESALMSRRAEALSRLRAQRSALTAAFADQQTRLAGLASARAEVGTLLTRLREQLRAEELAAALRALANGTPLSFGQWAKVFLGAIRAPAARNNLVVMVAWQAAEYTAARWNPLATTYPMPGATMFNSSRVRNYVSLQQGIEATIRTLRHRGYGYEAILSNLARNAEPMTTARAINASRWCSGCTNGRYVIGLIPSVEEYFDRYANASA